MTPKPNGALTILRMPQFEARIGLKKSSLYARLDPGSKYFDPKFPKPISLASGVQSGAVGWIESEVDDYIRSRICMENRAKFAGGQSE